MVDDIVAALEAKAAKLERAAACADKIERFCLEVRASDAREAIAVVRRAARGREAAPQRLTEQERARWQEACFYVADLFKCYGTGARRPNSER